MNNTLETLQRQRDTFAQLVTLLAAPQHADDRTWAVDFLDLTHQAIQTCFGKAELYYPDGFEYIIRMNNAVIEKLNAAIVALPDTEWGEVSA